MEGKYQQNIFELLSEDGAKKQKPKQQGTVAPKKQAKAAPAKAEPKKQQQGGRDQGGRGGRGRSNRGGRGEGRGRGGDVAITNDDRQGGNNNRGRQVSRRQRDEAFKRGDYGSPDAEGHQKKPYDKYSHSSASRRKQEKKGGHGAGNWGESGKDDVIEEKKEGEETEKVEEENVEAEGEEAEQEEEDNEIDMEEFKKNQKEESEKLSKLFDAPEKRVVDSDLPEGMQRASKGKEEQLFPITGGKKNKKKTANQKDGKVSADKVLNFQAPRQDNRRNNKGRQNNRPQRGGKRNFNLDEQDKDFPTLG